MDIATNSEDNEALAGSLPTFPSLVLYLYLKIEDVDGSGKLPLWLSYAISEIYIT